MSVANIRGNAMKPRRYWLGRIVVAGLRSLTHVLLKLRVEGIEQVPATGPVVLIANHVNFLDPVLTYTIHRRYVKGLTADKTFRQAFFRFLAWSVDAIPVARGTPDLSAIRACVETLEAGWALYIAPEGTRSGHGRLQEAHAGVVVVLSRADQQIPVFPIAYIGLEHFWPTFRKLRRTPVRIVVGEPFYVSWPEGRVHQAEREQILSEMMGAIAVLLPPENRGRYADQVGRASRYLVRAPATG
jgi:1-acyl-sn-glycerol-3-phosphate acyltransferase